MKLSIPLSDFATSPAALARLPVIVTSAYALSKLPFQISPAIPAKFPSRSPTACNLPINATFLNRPLRSILLTIPAILLFPRMLPVTLIFSTVAFLTVLASAEISLIQGILILTFAKLIFLTEPPSIPPNN